MIMMNGDSPVPGSSPSLPVSAALPASSGNLETAQFPNGPPPCAGCGQPIQDEFILRVQGHMWHAQCLRCAACQVSLAHTCYVRGNRVFCRMDFFRLFGASCAGCGDVIPPSEVVRTAHENIYHLKCFVCVMCCAALNTGDEFYLRHDGKLICKVDFHSARDQQQVSPDEPDGHRQDLCQGRQQQQPPLPPPLQQQPQQQLGNIGNVTFTQQETEILQGIYRACPNPSHDTLQQISRQNRLDPRRVRLWFHAHRKENSPRNCRAAFNLSPNVGEDVMERAVAPPGGYPLPIVNEATSSGRLPMSSRSDLTGNVPLPINSSSVCLPGPWPVSEDVWRADFVPPNVDLNPGDIKNGEVCDSRRGLAPITSDAMPITGNQCRYPSSAKGDNNACPPEQLQHHGEMALPWMDS